VKRGEVEGEGLMSPSLEWMSEKNEIGNSRIDPRSGVVSPQAVARDSALERGELPMANLPRRG